MILYVFLLTGHLSGYGSQSLRVIATDVIDAMAQISARSMDEDQWMISRLRDVKITREFLARCEHWDAEGHNDSDLWECEDCPSTWRDGDAPEPTATRAGFQAYCDNLRRYPEEDFYVI